MVDRISKEHRSWNMSRIKSKNTKPERIVRSLLHRQGYRFRLYKADLPGSPDIVLPKYKTIIFIHGCFWHRHQGCRYAYEPKSHINFWQTKFQKNILRDNEEIQKLIALGWKVEVIWECQTEDIENLKKRIKEIFCC